MNIKPLHVGFKCPVKASQSAGAYDLYMPEDGHINISDPEGTMVELGFAAAVPEGYVALLLPRSGKGAKDGVSLNNTVGVIDADYRGEWRACLRLRNERPFTWVAGDRVLQMLIVPAAQVDLMVVEELYDTDRGHGGFGSTGE